MNRLGLYSTWILLVRRKGVGDGIAMGGRFGCGFASSRLGFLELGKGVGKSIAGS